MVRNQTRLGRLGVRVAAGLSAVWWGFFFFGLIDLLVPIDQSPGFYEGYLLETGWGVLYTFLVAAPFLSLAARPTLVAPLLQVCAVGLCLGVAAVAAAAWVQLLPAVLLVANAYGVSWLARGPLTLDHRWNRPPVDWVVAGWSLVLLPPATVFAVDMISAYRTRRQPFDITNGLDHWTTQAALVWAVAATAAVVAASLRGRWSGTWAAVACVATAAGWFGALSAIYPEHAGSIGRAWGIGLCAWAAVFVAATACRAVRYRASPRSGEPTMT